MEAINWGEESRELVRYILSNSEAEKEREIERGRGREREPLTFQRKSNVC